MVLRQIAVLSLLFGFISLFASPVVASAAEKNEIVIGSSLPLTGNLAGLARDLKWAYEMGVARANASGGVFVKDYGKKLKIRLVLVDDGANPMRTASSVERLINVDKVDMLLGAATSLHNIPGATVAEKYGKYYHTSFSWDNVWRKKNFKWATDLFVSGLQAAEVPFKILGSIQEENRPRNVALVVEDTFSGESFGKVSKVAAEKNGYSFKTEIRLPTGAKDYSSQISKLKQVGTNAMLVFTNTADCERLVQQLKQDNVNIPFIQTWKGGWPGRFWKDLGKDSQYILCDGFWSMDYPYAGAKELGEQYYKQFGEYSVDVGLPYALTQVLFQAIEKAGSLDAAKLRASVLSNTFDTVLGPVKYDRDGVALVPPMSAQWWDGKQEVVYPPQYATWKLKLAPAWSQR